MLNASMLELLFLIVLANGVPVLARKLFATHLSMPVDANKLFIDGRPLFGDSKTWRGVIASTAVVTLVAMLLGFDAMTGAIIALSAMTGDLLSSFVKRRLGLPPSSMAPLIDQIPESLFPALLMMHELALSIADVIVIVVAFIILEVVLSKILYQMGVRKRPY